MRFTQPILHAVFAEQSAFFNGNAFKRIGKTLRSLRLKKNNSKSLQVIILRFLLYLSHILISKNIKL